MFYRTGDADLATDIAQETFIRIWEKQFDYHPKKTKALLYKITFDLCVNHYRKEKVAGEYLKEIKYDDKEKEKDFIDRLIRFVQTRKDNKDYGNKSICEDLTKKEIKTIFANDSIKYEILDNPYQYAFLVDLEAQYINGEIKLYKITNLKDKIDLD